MSKHGYWISFWNCRCFRVCIDTTIKALEITWLDIMNFLTLLPPQRLSVEDCKSWETVCPDKFWNFLYWSSDKKLCLQRKNFASIPRSKRHNWTFLTNRTKKQRFVWKCECMNGYMVQPSNLSSALVFISDFKCHHGGVL